jgi:putative endonuclease
VTGALWGQPPSSTTAHLSVVFVIIASHRRQVPYVYILECRDGSYYVGSTWDLERRLGEHQTGLGAAYTRRRRPVRLVWSAWYNRVADAYAFEKQVQGWGRAKRQALIEGRLGDLGQLARRPRRPEKEGPPAA